MAARCDARHSQRPLAFKLGVVVFDTAGMPRLHPQFTGPLLLTWAAMLAACGGGSGASAPTANVPPGAAYGISASNLQIATALYQDSQRTPPGFYADPAPPGVAAVATLHLKSQDVAGASGADFELCSDDWNQALTWSETAANYHGVYAALVASSSTARYFEFDRTVPGTPVLYVRQRVYQCTYLNRSDSSVGVNDGPAGVLNLKPVAAADLSTLSEYLWRFTGWNNYGNAVLSSAAAPAGSGLAHQLIIASVVSNGTSAGCDRIDVVSWQHTLDAASGALQRTITPLWSFGAQQQGAAAVDCGG